MNNRQEKMFILATIAIALSSVVNATLQFMEHELKFREILVYIVIAVLLIASMIIVLKAFGMYFRRPPKIATKSE